MAETFTFNQPPVNDRDEVRQLIGDTVHNDGPLPDRENLADEMLESFLAVEGNVYGAAALAFDHLAARWITRPVFGPGELATIHVDNSAKFQTAADRMRRLEAELVESTPDSISNMELVRSDTYEV